jgi:hypothetical protein
MSYQNEVRDGKSAPAALNLDTMPLEELRLLALQEARQAQAGQGDPHVRAAREEADRLGAQAAVEHQSSRASSEASTSDAEPELFVSSKTVDIGDGAGSEVFTAEGATEAESLKNLVEKISDEKKHATLKIRQQERRVKELEAQVQNAELLAGDELAIAEKMDSRGVTFDDLASVATAYKQQKQIENSQQEAAKFLALHEDYLDTKKNGELMRMKLAEWGLPATTENLTKAYQSLTAQNLLESATEGIEQSASPHEQQFRDERGRFVQQPTQSQTPTRRASGISTQGSNRTMPSPRGTSEEEAYRLPMEELKKRANSALRSAVQNEDVDVNVDNYRIRSSGTLYNR